MTRLLIGNSRYIRIVILTLLLIGLGFQVFEDGFGGDPPGTYSVVRALHFRYVSESCSTADQATAGERELRNALEFQIQYSRRHSTKIERLVA